MTRLIPDERVRAHFTMEMCIAAVENAFEAAGRRPFDVTERRVVAVDDGARLLSLTSASDEFGRLVANVYSGAPSGHDKRTSSVNRRQKLYLLFDSSTGACDAIISGGRLAWLKTGAMGAVAIRHLSDPDARTLAIIGTGRQARSALEAALLVRDFDEVRIWSRTPGNPERMISEMGGLPRSLAARSAREAVHGADVVVTATTATEPVLSSAWLTDGCHVNAIGAHYPGTREIDGETVAMSSVFVDTRVAATAEKGELLLAREEGRFSFSDIVGELGEIVAGTIPWRRANGETTLFASSGSAIESMGAAVGALDAVPPGEGIEFEF